MVLICFIRDYGVRARFSHKLEIYVGVNCCCWDTDSETQFLNWTVAK